MTPRPLARTFPLLCFFGCRRSGEGPPLAFSSERPVRPFARGTFRSVKEAEARLVVVVREAVVLIVVIVVVPLRDVVVVVVVVVVLVIVVLVAVVVVRVSGVGFGAEN